MSYELERERMMDGVQEMKSEEECSEVGLAWPLRWWVATLTLLTLSCT